MHPIARALIIVGVVLILTGLAWQFGARFFPGFGKLPGDIAIVRPGYRFYFPIVTCLILSALFSLISYLFRKF